MQAQRAELDTAIADLEQQLARAETLIAQRTPAD